MNQLKIIKQALLQAMVAAVYVALVATLITNAPRLFGSVESLLGAVAFLLTFVLSAAVMGITIFGLPLRWYLDGKKKEAVALVLYTVGWLLFITVVVFVILIIR